MLKTTKRRSGMEVEYCSPFKDRIDLAFSQRNEWKKIHEVMATAFVTEIDVGESPRVIYCQAIMCNAKIQRPGLTKSSS